MESLLPPNSRISPTCCSHVPPIPQRKVSGGRRTFRGNAARSAAFEANAPPARKHAVCPSELLLRCQLLNRSSCRASAQTCRSAAGHSPAVVPPSVERSQQTPLWSSADRDASGNPSPPRAGQQVEKVGVLLLNLGGPETLDDVQPFLYNLFNDDSIIRLPAQVKFLQPLVASIISTLRAPKSAEGYKSIGGGSPLRRITEEQANALAASLKTKGLDAQVYVGMRYWKPFTEEAIEQIKQDGITRLVVLPLYPQFSISTSASSLRLFENMLQRDPQLQGLKHTVIASWYWREGYLTAMADLIEAELRKFEKPDDVEIFFSAHGVPTSYVEEFGDPYKEEMEQCVDMVMDRIRRRSRNNRHTLAYQSRVGPVEWLKPYTDDAIRELGEKGTKSLLAVPISFVSEHIETLEEIDMEYRELALESGIANWGRVPALNTNETFINDLADLVLEKLPSAQPRPGYVLENISLGPPTGSVEELLDTYDRDRRVLPPPVQVWEWGWTKSAEVLNGRIAMIAVLVMLVLEAATGQGVLSNWLKL